MLCDQQNVEAINTMRHVVLERRVNVSNIEMFPIFDFELGDCQEIRMSRENLNLGGISIILL